MKNILSSFLLLVIVLWKPTTTLMGFIFSSSSGKNGKKNK
jgi:hypothetical protein